MRLGKRWVTKSGDITQTLVFFKSLHWSVLPGGYITQQACTTMSLQRRHLARHTDEKTMHAFLCLCIPLVVLLVGWHQVGALPGCDCSGISHQGPSAGCNAAYLPTRRGGCNATEEYTSACPAAV